MAHILIVPVTACRKSVMRSELAALQHRVTLADLDEQPDGADVAEPPELVLVDSVAGGTSAIEICCRVKEDARWKDLPLVVAVERDREHLVESMLHAGADDFVIWPIAERVLAARIASALRFGQNRAMLGRVTDRLAANEARFRDFARSTDDWIWEIDASLRFTFCSDRVKEVLGYEAAEVVGCTPYDFIPGEEAVRLRSIIDHDMVWTEPFHDREIWHRRRDGRLVLLNVRGVPIRDSRGELVGYRGASADITDRKNAEIELFENRELLHQLIEHLPVAVFVKSGKEGRFTLCNRQCEILFGQPREAVLGKTNRDLWPDEQADFFTAVDREVLHTGAVRHVAQEELDAADGTTRLCRAVKVPLRDSQGRIAHVLGVLEDVTDRLAAEGALRASEAKLRTISDAALDAIVLADAEGRIVHWNPAAHQMFGYEAHEVLGRNVHDVLAPAEVRTAAQRAQRLAAAQAPDGKCFGLQEVQGVRKDGTRIPIEISLAYTTIDGRRWMVGILRDISSRRALQQSLAAALAQLQGVLDSATQVAIIATDPAGTITVFNVGAERLLGYRAEELVGKHTPEIFHDSAELAEQAHLLSEELGRPVRGFETFIVRAERGGCEQRHWTYVRKDGKRILVDLIVTAVRASDGTVVGWLGVALDITKRKRAEERLAQAKETAEMANRAKSEFLANMSHELRTPLHGILSFAQFGLKKANKADREELRHFFQRIENSGQTLLELVNDLLDLSKLESGRCRFDLERIRLGDVVSSLADEVGSAADERQIRVRYQPAGFDTTVRGDPRRIAQVMRNLLANAVRFAPDGSEVDVTAENLGESVRVRVLDRGPGIPQKELDLVFDKFFQSSKTRNGAGGTGLGLAICREIVEGHGGRIWAENREGGGALLTFDLPRRPPRPSESDDSDSADPPLSATQSPLTDAGISFQTTT